MASSYPGALDSFTNPSSTDAMDASAALYHDTQHANANDAIEAVQAELGTDPAGAYPTVAARLATTPTSYYASPSGFLNGCDYWTHDPALCNSGQTVTSQSVKYVRWVCPASFTATKLWWVQSAAAATVTGAWIGIYDSSGTKLQEADISSVVTSTGLKSATITGQSVTAGSVYYLAALVVASTGGGFAGWSIHTALDEISGASDSDRVAYSQNTQSALPSSVTLSGLTTSPALLMLGVSAS